jgi:hypothetical protein
MTFSLNIRDGYSSIPEDVVEAEKPKKINRTYAVLGISLLALLAAKKMREYDAWPTNVPCWQIIQHLIIETRSKRMVGQPVHPCWKS